MIPEEKEKIHNILYNKKCIADYREEDPFVGIYFNDLIDLLEDLKNNFTQENIPYTADEIKAMVKTIEELRKKYNEALERTKVYHTGGSISDAHITEVIFPELKGNNNDEKIRNRLIAMCQHYIECYSLDPYNVDDYKEALAWLEKQNNTSDKEYVFRPLAGDTIEKAAEQAVKLDGKVVLAFNGTYIPVDNKTKDEIIAEYRNWVKKQSAQTTNK